MPALYWAAPHLHLLGTLPEGVTAVGGSVRGTGGHSSRGNGATAPRSARQRPRVLSVGMGRTRGLSSVPETQRAAYALRASLQQGPSPPPPCPVPQPRPPESGRHASAAAPWRLEASEPRVLAALSGQADTLPSHPPAPTSLTRPVPLQASPTLPTSLGTSLGASNAQATGPSTSVPPPQVLYGVDWLSATCQHKGIQD